MEHRTNSERFIAAYNRLDKTIRDIYNFKPALTFSDVVRKSAEVNYVVKKYEDDLIDYGRIRKLGLDMAKTKAPKAYKNMIKYIYTVNTSNLKIYKEPNLV